MIVLASLSAFLRLVQLKSDSLRDSQKFVVRIIPKLALTALLSIAIHLHDDKEIQFFAYQLWAWTYLWMTVDVETPVYRQSYVRWTGFIWWLSIVITAIVSAAYNTNDGGPSNYSLNVFGLVTTILVMPFN